MPKASYLGILISFFCLSQAFSQSVILGKVFDANEALPFVNIVLYNYNDSNKIGNGTVSDLYGNFIIKQHEPETFIIKATCVGYEPIKQNIEWTGSDTIMLRFDMKPSVNKLDEVVVRGNLIQQTASKDIYVISNNERKYSPSGFEVVKILPKINIDLVNQKITTIKGEAVKILVNGINADETDLLSLKPEEITRIEYYDMPPAKYASYNVASVINVITRKSQIGTEGSVSLQSAVTTGFSNNNFKLKYTNNKCQLAFNYFLSYRNYHNKQSNDYYKYIEGNSEFEKIKKGRPGPFSYNLHNIDINFTHSKDSTAMFDISLVSFMYFNKNRLFQEILTTNENKYSISESIRNEYKPSLDIYFSKKLRENQELVFNTVVTYFDTKYHNHYIEYQNNDTSFASLSNIDGSKASVITECLYNKLYNNFKLSIGIKHVQGYSATSDQNMANSKINSFTMDNYMFIEGEKSLKAISYSAGIGFNYSMFDSRGLDNRYKFFTLRPNVNFSYKISSDQIISWKSTIKPITPSLMGLSNIKLYIDSLLIYTGNPGLKPYNILISELTYSLSRGALSCSPSLTYSYSNNPILNKVGIQDGCFVQMQANQIYERKYSVGMGIKWSPFATKWIDLNFYGERYKTENKIDDKIRSFADNYFQGALTVFYKNLSFKTSIETNYKSLDGDMLFISSNDSYFKLQYKRNALTLSATLLCPFDKSWNTTSETYKVDFLKTRLKTDIYDNGRMLYFNFRYNFSSGKRNAYKSKNFFNEDNDSGILKLN